MKKKPLEIRLLGDLALLRGGVQQKLPQSKKTRALLAYLIASGRRHRRDRLCGLFWDVTDDPRGALRWSLSKLRPLVDDPGQPRIVADRETVGFVPGEAAIDLVWARSQMREREQLDLATLERLAETFRGEFLEGLELPEFHDFQAWCVALREEVRVLHVAVLRALVAATREQPGLALPHARLRVQVDPLAVDARVDLIRILVACGHRREAEQQVEIGKRVFRDLGSGSPAELDRVWHALRESNGGAAGSVQEAPAAVGIAAAEPSPPAAESPLVGRTAEWTRLAGVLDEVGKPKLRMVLLCGEPGIGKTRLLSELAAEVRVKKGTVLDGRAYEAESGRPYGPWIDALRRLPAVSVGSALGADLAPLLPELAREAPAGESRDRLFGAVVELIAARAHSAPPVLISFDDVQWCDAASVELLHYVVRMSRHRPILVVLAARPGELPDNEPVQRLLRGLRHDAALDEIDLPPLSAAATRELVATCVDDAHLGRVARQSAGNPFFALEIARSIRERGEAVPSSLRQLVRDRVARLSPEAGDVLTWAAILGRTFGVQRLAELTSLDIDRLVAALTTLERHQLLRTVDPGRGGAAYMFAHDIVRQVVYGEASEPRRRLMHGRAARALEAHAASDASLFSDVAHHAALAGEDALATVACIAAGRHCLRLFANREAETLARRGWRHAESLPERDRVLRGLELAEVRLTARRPAAPEAEAQMLEDLAERALDLGCAEHARLGFHLLSYLRWEGGEWSAARRHMLRAEEASRGSGEPERVVAMAEAARCLALLERDLPDAEALLLEARARSARLRTEPTAIPDAEGMLRLHQGRFDEARDLFERARVLARRHQDHYGEFNALEHLVMLELERSDYARAQSLCAELSEIAGRLREGSEAPFAFALAALVASAQDASRVGELDDALVALRAADAKHRLAFALTRAADIDVRRGEAERARRRAEEALAAALALDRPTEKALARVVLARAALALGDEAGARRELASLDAAALRGVAMSAASAIDDLRRQLTAFGAAVPA